MPNINMPLDPRRLIGIAEDEIKARKIIDNLNERLAAKYKERGGDYKVEYSADLFFAEYPQVTIGRFVNNIPLAKSLIQEDAEAAYWVSKLRQPRQDVAQPAGNDGVHRARPFPCQRKISRSV